MLFNTWLKTTSKKLGDAGIITARLDCLVLAEDETGKDRGWLLAHPEFKLSGTQTQRLDHRVNRRAEHEPLAYIRSKTEFYGREFFIDHRVLEPRPESEAMIEILKAWGLPGQISIADVGTGSGMLAITVKLELPTSKVMATDIDQNCLDVARKNAKKFNVNVNFLHGDLIDPLPSHDPLVILANLPYVPDHFHLNPSAMREPRLAIFGGPDGLDVYRKLFKQIQKLPAKPNLILTEALPPQHELLAGIAKATGFRLEKSDGFVQLFSRD